MLKKKIMYIEEKTRVADGFLGNPNIPIFKRSRSQSVKESHKQAEGELGQDSVVEGVFACVRTRLLK